MNDGERVVERRCRWCRRVYRVPPDYPKRAGCPNCAPRLGLEYGLGKTAPPYPNPEQELSAP